MRVSLKDFAFRKECTTKRLTVNYEVYGGKTYQKYPVIVYGRRTYFDDAELNISLPGNLLAGHYTSVAKNVRFTINENHDFGSVTNFPMYRLNLGEGLFPHLLRDEPMVLPVQRQILLGSDVWIGRDVSILGGVRISNGAIIGTGAVVTKDVPPYAIAGGNPARVIKYRFPPEICQKLDAIQWWDWPDERIRAAAPLFQRPEAFVEKYYRPPAEETLQAAADIRQQHGVEKLFLVLADDKSEWPDWEHVFIEWQRAGVSGGKLLILLNTLEDERKERFVERFRTLMAAEGHRALVQGIGVEIPPDQFDEPLLRAADYFIAGKGKENITWANHADTCGTKVLSALDTAPFAFLGKK